jgi:Raf kinase inhibitor-like YbhB/YbcL family protein
MRTRSTAAFALLAITSMGAALAQAPAGGPPGGGAAPARPAVVPMLVESKAFADGGIVPLKYSFYGSNTQPDFHISNLPPTAQTVAIIMHDLDVAQGGNTDDVLHWVAWNIPVSNGMAMIEEGKLPEGGVHGRGARPGQYFGMGAPNGPRYHHYTFEFYALNGKLDIPATSSRPELLEAMKGKVVAKAAYMGRFRNDTNAVPPGGAGGPPRGPGAPGAGGPPPAR